MLVHVNIVPRPPVSTKLFVVVNIKKDFSRYQTLAEAYLDHGRSKFLSKSGPGRCNMIRAGELVLIASCSTREKELNDE